MKCCSVHVVGLLVALFVAPATSVVIAPAEGDCWSSTFAIISAEIVSFRSYCQVEVLRPLIHYVHVVQVAPGRLTYDMSRRCSSPSPLDLQAAVFNRDLYNTQRTYILCVGIITVGDVPEGALSPVGGDYPLVVFNANLNIKCEVPGTCILDGGTTGEELVTNLLDTSLLEAFLSVSGLPPPPEGYVVDSTNLLIEGVVFSGASAARADAPIELGGTGLNMVFDHCLWTNHDVDYPPQSAIFLQYVDPPGLSTPGELYQSVTIKNSIITANTFTYAFVRTSWSGPQPPPGIVNEIIFEDSAIMNNVIEGDIRGDDGFSVRPSLFTLFSTRLVLVNTRIVSNAIGRFNGVFNLENGAEIVVAGDTLLADITASEPLNPSCEEIVLWDVVSDFNATCGCSENVTYTEADCLSIDSIFLTHAPSPSPVSAPTRVPGGAAGESKAMGMGMHGDAGSMMGMGRGRRLLHAATSPFKDKLSSTIGTARIRGDKGR
jgi:hypothetical protein